MNHAMTEAYQRLCGSTDHDRAYRAFCVGECQLPVGTFPATWLVRGYDQAQVVGRAVATAAHKAIERHCRKHPRAIGCDKSLGPWRRCGGYAGGRMVLCDECETRANLLYPQGWRGYPGDTCKHGVYVGGCGVDHICPRCEYGDEEASNYPR